MFTDLSALDVWGSPEGMVDAVVALARVIIPLVAEGPASVEFRDIKLALGLPSPADRQLANNNKKKADVSDFSLL